MFSGKIKLGSVGEYEIKAIKTKIPIKDTKIPVISISLLTKKLKTELAIFLFPYLMNQIYHFVSSNFIVKIKIIMT